MNAFGDPRTGERWQRLPIRKTVWPASVYWPKCIHTRAALKQRYRWHKYAANDQIIDRESESRDVYFIVEGRVRMVNYSLSEREVIFDEMAAGSHFGELAALIGEPRSANVVALTETRVASISSQTFTNLFLENAGLGLKITTMFARIVRTSTDRIMDLSTLGAHNRVHSEILREAREKNALVVHDIDRLEEMVAGLRHLI